MFRNSPEDIRLHEPEVRLDANIRDQSALDVVVDRLHIAS